MWGWLAITCPWLFFNNRVKVEVAQVSHQYLGVVEKGFLAGRNANHDRKVETNHRDAPPPSEVELCDWVGKTLPLISGVLSEGLRLPRLIEAADIPGGFHVLMSMFDTQELGLELSRGERLVLSSAAMRKASTKTKTKADFDSELERAADIPSIY
jgi:hypothetical protein